MQTTAWLFDLYPRRSRLVLWFITADGERLRLEDEFPYRLYLRGEPPRVRRLAQELGRRGWVRRACAAHGRDLHEEQEIPVLAVELSAYEHLPRLRNWLAARPGEVACYNADLDPASYYLYAKRLWPCTWYEVQASAGRLLKLTPLEDPFALELACPPLATLSLGLTRDPLIPLGRGNGLTLGWDGRTLEPEAPDAAALVAEVAHWLRRLDPDLVISDWGDEKIVPPLWRWSRRYRVALPLDRETEPVPREFRPGRSYFSYGRRVYQGAAAPFYGRWHVDRRNSFFFREAGLAGLMQIARLGQMPLQQTARASPGTLITSMQLSRAVADGILIPWRKGEPEQGKSAGELLTIDKGGLVFLPPVGVHFQVAELDFASMYPSIMVLHNISPETVNCRCCGDLRGRGPQTPRPSPHQVPEAGYHLCRRREGLVPRTLRPLLHLRQRLKVRAKEAGPTAAAPYQERQNALKWLLVTCFGYLGYKNARFGRIEAHEAVTAFGRDKLLTAKEICEGRGFRVLHGLTDCLWVQKAGLTEAELAALGDEISAATGVRLALEGVYRWLVFLPSRQQEKRPVANRFFGVFTDSSLKVRGLLCRRRDTPPFVRRAQEDLLAHLADAMTASDLAARLPELEEMAAGFRQRLREGGLPPQDLAITRVLSQPLEDYKVATPTALAARRLEACGLTLLPGEKVRYVHMDKVGLQTTRVRPAPFLDTLDAYDTAHYLKLLNRALDEILLPLRRLK
jgi:DNA polymerase II